MMKPQFSYGMVGKNLHMVEIFQIYSKPHCKICLFSLEEEKINDILLAKRKLGFFNPMFSENNFKEITSIFSHAKSFLENLCVTVSEFDINFQNDHQTFLGSIWIPRFGFASLLRALT